jgi:hypothetical protein
MFGPLRTCSAILKHDAEALQRCLDGREISKGRQSVGRIFKATNGSGTYPAGLRQFLSRHGEKTPCRAALVGRDGHGLFLSAMLPIICNMAHIIASVKPVAMCQRVG